jgi:hypothetical protein
LVCLYSRSVLWRSCSRFLVRRFIEAAEKVCDSKVRQPRGFRARRASDGGAKLLTLQNIASAPGRVVAGTQLKRGQGRQAAELEWPIRHVNEQYDSQYDCFGAGKNPELHKSSLMKAAI